MERSGGGGSYGTSVSVSAELVGDEPTLFWLIIPGEIRYLKQFWEVTMAVTNLGSGGTTFTNGQANLALPSRREPRPTATPQTATKPLADVAGAGTQRATWIVRGDTAAATPCARATGARSSRSACRSR